MSRISVVGWKKGLEILDQRLTEVEENGGGGGVSGVTSINGQDGVVVLSAADVGALPDTYTPPASTWASVTGKPAVIGAGADAAAARTAIGAGTSNLTIGTTSATAAAGNHTHTGAQINLTGYTIGTVANAAVAAADSINAAIAKLEKRIADLEAG